MEYGGCEIIFKAKLPSNEMAKRKEKQQQRSACSLREISKTAPNLISVPRLPAHRLLSYARHKVKAHTYTGKHIERAPKLLFHINYYSNGKRNG